MHLSKVIIRNYRSIKNMEISFQSGKNVLIGKNNAGKSNIIKAIDLVLGETAPTYYKYENITETDFYTEKRYENDQPVVSVSNEIVIVCLLQRSPNEGLNFDAIDKCTGFFKMVQNKRFKPLSYDENRVSVTDFNQKEIGHIFTLDVNEEDETAPGYIPRQTNLHWVDSKLSNQRKFRDELESQFQFAYVFRAIRTGEKVSKDIRFLFREQEHCDWHIGFSAPIRNELLQSAIISSFRDPQNILRINQWSWFGKLLRASIDTGNQELQDAFLKLRTASDKVFSSLHKDINDSRIQVAFPETEISIQFNPDTKIDIYKSALIYVDDGFNSQLQDKGSGIQSAVTIGLFNYYIRHFAHQSSSLLIVEEPEIYLHPQARRVISNRIDDFLDNQQSQAIITTHSPEFITSAHENLNIILVRKGKDGSSDGLNVSFAKSKERQMLVQKQNAEMFFADTVLLVEGGEKYIIEVATQFYGTQIKPFLGANWLDDRNCSVIAVGGKTEFWKYYNKLSELGIRVYILADFDFFLRGLADFFTKTNMIDPWKRNYNDLNSKLQPNLNDALPDEIESAISQLVELIVTMGMSVDPKKIRKEIRQEIRIKKYDQLPEEFKNPVARFIHELHQQNIFIMPGELEDCYTESSLASFQGMSLGKEEKPIFIVSELIEAPEQLQQFVILKSYFKFFDLVTAIWEPPQKKE